MANGWSAALARQRDHVESDQRNPYIWPDSVGLGRREPIVLVPPSPLLTILSIFSVSCRLLSRNGSMEYSLCLSPAKSSRRAYTPRAQPELGVRRANRQSPDISYFAKIPRYSLLLDARAFYRCISNLPSISTERSLI